MDNTIMKMINEGNYSEAADKAYEMMDNYQLDEAKEIFEELYDRISDSDGRNSDEALRIMCAIADICYRQGNYDEALSLYNSIISGYTEKGKDSDINAIAAMTNISRIYELYNRYDEEYEICRKALDIALGSYTEESQIVINVLQLLASCCDRLGEYDEAISYYEHILKITKGTEGIEPIHIAMTYDGLGRTYEDMGQINKAMAAYETGAEILKNSSQDDTEDLLGILNDIAGLYDNLGEYEKQLETYKDIYERAKKLYGFDHPNVIVALSNIASAYECLGDYNKAAEIFEKAYSWNNENLGEEHHETLRIMYRLSMIYNMIGKFDEALKYSENVYRMNYKILGEEHLDTILSLGYIAECLDGASKHSDAKETQKKVADDIYKYYGETLDYLNSYGYYLNLCINTGDYAEIFENAEKLRNKFLSVNEPAYTEKRIRNLDNTLAVAYCRTRKYDKAIGLQEKVVSSYEAEYGKEHPYTLNDTYDLANFYYLNGDIDKALEICSGIVRIQEENNIIYPNPYKYKILLAAIYSSAGETDKAHALLDRIVSAGDIDNYPAAFSDACYEMAENYCNTKEYDKALPFAEKSYDTRKNIYEDKYIDVKNSAEQCEKIRKELKNETV